MKEDYKGFSRKMRGKMTSKVHEYNYGIWKFGNFPLMLKQVSSLAGFCEPLSLGKAWRHKEASVYLSPLDSGSTCLTKS
jgi:hypothetical protein